MVWYGKVGQWMKIEILWESSKMDEINLVEVYFHC
jgi:hypothetical protein